MHDEYISEQPRSNQAENQNAIDAMELLERQTLGSGLNVNILDPNQGQVQPVVMDPAYLEQLQNANAPYQIIPPDLGEGQEPCLLFVVPEGAQMA